MTSRTCFIWFIVCFLSVGQTAGTMLHARQVDSVPRDRLMSDSELLSELKDPQGVQNSASMLLSKGDTAAARKLLVDYFASRKHPRFFFTTGEVIRRVREYTRLFPNEVREANKRSDAFMKTYGADIDWRMPGKDLRGKEHTPNTVRYLARQWEAANLAVRFFQENQNPDILRFLMAHVRDFAADFEAGKVEKGDNDVFERFYGGHRIRNWIMMHQLLMASPLYTPDDQVLMLKLVLLHGARLADQSKSFNWGNHQLVGLVALYELSTMFPEFKAAAVWHDRSRKLILEHLDKEIAADGFQAERSSHYHKLDIVNYFLVLQLARRNGEIFPPAVHDRFRNMFQAMADIAMPNKAMPILQDVSDSLDVRSDRIDEEMSLGALLYGDRTYRYFARAEFPASFYWYFDRGAISRYKTLKPRAPTYASRSLPQTGYYVMRTGWGADARYLLIDGGLAADKPDHTHGGVLGVIGFALGDVVLPNYPVRYSDKSYKDMKNSLAKNVALVDDILQGRDWVDNKARTGFGRWLTLPKPSVEEWVNSSEFDCFSATHDAFSTAGVQYRRTVVFLKPNAWLVIDSFNSTAKHRYQQLWQGDFEIVAGAKEAVHKSKKGYVELIPAGKAGIEIVKHQAALASGVRFLRNADGPAEMATLIHVGKGAATPAERASVIQGDSSYTVRIGTTTWVVGRENNSPSALSGHRGLISIVRYKAKAIEAVLAVNGARLQTGELDVTLTKSCSAQLVKDKQGRWVLTLVSGGANALTAKFKNQPSRSYDIAPGQSLVLTPEQ